LTYGVSLWDWYSKGHFSREISYYKELATLGINVKIISYGDSSDFLLKKLLGDIEIIPMYANRKKSRRPLQKALMSVVWPIMNYKKFEDVHVFKTNQLFGGWVPLILAVLNRKKLFVRLGYEPLQNAIKANDRKILLIFIWISSFIVYRSANEILVTSPSIRRFIMRKYFVAKKMIKVKPNWVNTKLFNDDNPKTNAIFTVLYVGRLAPEKNIDLLLESCAGLDLKVVVVGEGPLNHNLKKIARQSRLNIEFVGMVPNEKLPDFYNNCDLFCLPSSYEGSPKSLIEALSCGCLVLASDIVGNSSLISDKSNGILSPLNRTLFKANLIDIYQNYSKYQQLKNGARKFAVDNLSMESHLQFELEIIKNLKACITNV